MASPGSPAFIRSATSSGKNAIAWKKSNEQGEKTIRRRFLSCGEISATRREDNLASICLQITQRGRSAWFVILFSPLVVPPLSSICSGITLSSFRASCATACGLSEGLSTTVFLRFQEFCAVGLTGLLTDP